ALLQIAIGIDLDEAALQRADAVEVVADTRELCALLWREGRKARRRRVARGGKCKRDGCKNNDECDAAHGASYGAIVAKERPYAAASCCAAASRARGQIPLIRSCSTPSSSRSSLGKVSFDQS